MKSHEVLPIPLPAHSDMWTIYGKNTCKYCKCIITMLQNRDHMFTFLDVDQYGGKQVVKDFLQKHANLTANYKKGPIIYFQDCYIGGYNDIREYLMS